MLRQLSLHTPAYADTHLQVIPIPYHRLDTRPCSFGGKAVVLVRPGVAPALDDKQQARQPDLILRLSFGP
jgi:hypothetical protein